MNPSRRERWPIPKTTRHVWVLRRFRWEVPWQGFVLAWEKRGAEWWAHVVYVDQEPVATWVPARSLVPIRSVPEEHMHRRGR